MTKNSLPRSSPDAERVSPEAIAALLSAAENYGGIDSVMVVRNGNVIAEQWWPPAAADEPHILWSVSKSFTSAAVGIAIDEGRFGLDHRVVVLLPDNVPAEPSPNLELMTVRDLLTMTSGHGAESLPDEMREREVDWLDWVLAQPVPHEPGTTFVYNSGATYLCSAIVQHTTGENLLAYLQPRLLEPLGISGMTTERSPQGIDCGGWGMFATTEDLAKFGQLYLQGGIWEGQQLLPADWVRASGSRLADTEAAGTSPDWKQGYGYYFWQCRHGAFRADGKDGQFIVVLPELELVVAMTAQLEDAAGELDLLWEKLLPGIS